MARSDHSDGSGEPLASEDEILLVELLYGELDEAEAEAARERIAGDEALRTELEDLERLRGVWRELPEEDPPGAVSSKVLHAASQAAPRAAGEGGGIWAAIQRFFAAARAHPAAYAMATLVLVGTVAGALYVSGVRSAAQDPAAGSEAPAADTAAEAPPASGPAAPEAEPGAGESTPDDTAPEAPAEEAEREGAAGRERAGASGRDDRRARAPRRPGAASGTANAGRGGGGAREPQQKRAPERQQKTPSPAPRADRDRSPGGGPRDDAPPAPAATAGESLDIGTEEPAPEEDADADEPAPDVRDLHRRARALAADGDCEGALRLGRRIRTLDERYHREQFRPDERIRPCRQTDRDAGLSE